MPDHPPAWGSPLWPHVDEIKSMRKRRQTWREIAEFLEATHGVKTTRGTVQRFFKRAKELKKSLPLGFDTMTGAEPGSDTPSEMRKPEPSKTASPEPEDPEAWIDEARALARPKTKLTITKPGTAL